MAPTVNGGFSKLVEYRTAALTGDAVTQAVARATTWLIVTRLDLGIVSISEINGSASAVQTEHEPCHSQILRDILVLGGDHRMLSPKTVKFSDASINRLN